MLDPMQFLNDASFHNDKGVALLEAGLQHEAFESFARALENISRLNRCLETRALLSKQSSHSSSPRHTLSTTNLNRRRRQFNMLQASKVLQNTVFCDPSNSQREISRGSNSNSHSCNSHSHSSSFLYQQAFRFNPFQLDGFMDEFSVHFTHLYKAIITFNCALSFHQRSDGVDQRLKKSAETYASQLYFDAIDQLRSCYSTVDSCLVLAATLNNAAMVCYEHHDFKKFLDLQQELHRLLVDMESSYPQAIDSRCIVFFYFNSKMLSVPQTAEAA